eukprot:TRINITY_DN56840_c0_g1_i1.p1 TRINITY_DN56840_c0_g1~~TRINITY_DN56840_c0_g1_i1.p1  ORF type:complete len:657 (-),score=119.95 TRINITY_DN56840_c0_g1_i1:109-2079(-)
MIVYDPGHWGIAFAFSLRGSVFPKAFVVSMPSSLSCLLLHSWIRSRMEFGPSAVSSESNLVNLLGGFTFILGFLIVFRSQQAYSRWWEGGTLLQQLRGEWFNSYSCLLAFCSGAEEKKGQVLEFEHQLVRLFSLLYGCALQQVSTLSEKNFELIHLDGMHTESIDFLQDSPDRCEVVLQWIQRLIVERNTSGVISVAPPILSRVFNELGKGIVNLNNARKILEFPMPFPLAQMITFMLTIHGLTTPLVCANFVGDPWLATVITFIVIFSYWSINYIALELEMPFGDDRNDLPLFEMQMDMNRSLITLVDERAQKVPQFTFRLDQHGRLSKAVVNFDGELIPSRAIEPTQSWRESLMSRFSLASKKSSLVSSSRFNNIGHHGKGCRQMPSFSTMEKEMAAPRQADVSDSREQDAAIAKISGWEKHMERRAATVAEDLSLGSPADRTNSIDISAEMPSSLSCWNKQMAHLPSSRSEAARSVGSSPGITLLEHGAVVIDVEARSRQKELLQRNVSRGNEALPMRKPGSSCHIENGAVGEGCHSSVARGDQIRQTEMLPAASPRLHLVNEPVIRANGDDEEIPVLTGDISVGAASSSRDSPSRSDGDCGGSDSGGPSGGDSVRNSAIEKGISRGFQRKEDAQHLGCIGTELKDALSIAVV